MATKYDASPDQATRPAEPPSGAGWQRVVKQLLAIFGAIAIFLGLFIMFAGADQSLGIGDWNWQVGDIAEGWGYGFLAGGVAMWVIGLIWVVQGRSRTRN
ncbi:MAG: hypothetical protein OEX97_10985 [Acidimicrobiia bacterium]|nr:hypothetical protein [Acidimicrobiia bacterium]